MDKITLNRVTVETKQLEVGLQLRYTKYSSENEAIGTVHKDDEGFFISWSDVDDITILNGDSKCMRVLDDCVWL